MEKFYNTIRKLYKGFCMKKSFKWMTLALAACGTFVGCGDSGSSADFDLEDSFKMVLSKANYEYKSKDSLMIIRAPECKESSLGYLVWNEESKTADTLEVYKKGSDVYMREDPDERFERVGFEGKSFPSGLWFNMDDAKESIRYARELNKDQVKDVFQYTGSCFMKSYYSQMFKNDYVSEADEALTAFYTMFQTDKNYEFDKEELINDLRAPSCDELMMYDGDVSIKIDNFQESSGKIVLSYNKNSCDINFSIRYAYDEEDCNAAYDEYKSDKNADEFDFNDYWKSVDYSYVCISRLVLQLQEDKGILKKSATLDESEAKRVANSAVDVILSGFKK